jgi:hypothetical protein
MAMSFGDIVLLDLREAVPALVALLAVLVAEALIDGALFVVVVVLIVVGMFAAFAYRDRSPGAIERASSYQRFLAQLDGTERAARTAARLLPLVVAIGLEAVVGFDTRLFATVVIAGLVVGEGLFGLLLVVRRRA